MGMVCNKMKGWKSFSFSMFLTFSFCCSMMIVILGQELLINGLSNLFMFQIIMSGFTFITADIFYSQYKFSEYY